MNSSRQHRRPRLRFPSIVLGALLLALFLAAGASAETRVGETSSTPEADTPAEAAVLGATASYDTGGTVSMTITTAAPPGNNPKVTMFAELVTSQGGCALAEIVGHPYPAMVFDAEYAKPEAEVLVAQEAEKEVEGKKTGGLEFVANTPRVVAGTTTTFTTSSSRLANEPFNCAVVGVVEQVEGGESKSQKAVIFPIAVKPPVPPVVTVTPPTTPAPPVLKGALAFPKTTPLKPVRERWSTVRFKVSNPGTAAIGPVTIKVKAPKGVKIEPTTLKLPALLSDQTWPAAFRIEVTDAAAAKSRIALSATASGLGATGSVVLRPTG